RRRCVRRRGARVSTASAMEHVCVRVNAALATERLCATGVASKYTCAGARTDGHTAWTPNPTIAAVCRCCERAFATIVWPAIAIRKTGVTPKHTEAITAERRSVVRGHIARLTASTAVRNVGVDIGLAAVFGPSVAVVESRRARNYRALPRATGGNS